jgi:hypothetical protein
MPFDFDPPERPAVPKEVFIGWARSGDGRWVSLVEGHDFGSVWAELLALGLGRRTDKVVLRQGQKPDETPARRPRR